MAKYKTQKEILELSKKLKQLGKVVVTTNGSFDILHYAHVEILEKAKQLGDILIVLLNSDNSIKKSKGPNRPIIPQEERMKMIASLECVDYVVIFKEDKPLNLLNIIKPNIHAKGGSFVPERIKEEKELLESWGGKFINFDLEEGYSTTNIINNILKVYK